MSGFWKRVKHTSISGAEYKGGDAWEQAGVDWGNGSKAIVIWFRSKEHVVFKVPAGKHWASITSPSVSHPGSYVVCRIIGDDSEDQIRTEELFQMPVSERGRGKI